MPLCSSETTCTELDQLSGVRMSFNDQLSGPNHDWTICHPNRSSKRPHPGPCRSTLNVISLGRRAAPTRHGSAEAGVFWRGGDDLGQVLALLSDQFQ
jgi:hypothetical protein